MRTAGVVRRTVYAHFPSREALVEGIADEASAALVAAMGDEARQPERPDLAEAMTITLLDQANSGEVQDSGESFAVAYLAVLGLTPAEGTRVVDEARRWLRENPAVLDR